MNRAKTEEETKKDICFKFAKICQLPKTVIDMDITTPTDGSSLENAKIV